jgi:AcrR family transcriptional regulator
MSVRLSQVERRARSRNALLEAAARRLSRHGYGNLVLEQVARDAGYTRGALYHQFEDKDDLVLQTLRWVEETWQREAGEAAAGAAGPVEAILAMARAHAIFCRHDLARLEIALRLEFEDADHPVAQELARITEALVRRLTRLITSARRDGSMPAGPPAPVVALAVIGALEGTVIAMAGQAPHDEEMAVRAVAGVLGVDPPR